MIKKRVLVIGCIFIAIVSCRKDEDRKVEIPDFNFPQTVSFESNLSAYNIFQGTLSNLTPSEDFALLELSSALFTDYAHKQRLIKVPDGSKVSKSNGTTLDFQDGTILTKTFFYYEDDRDTSLGRRIIETRLLIKEAGKWNAATYLWNEAQTDATLKLDGHDMEVSWTNSLGSNFSTLYHVPTQNECMTCHQSNSSMSPLGPTLLNLNRMVNRNGTELNQLTHLQLLGLLEQFSVADIPKMVDHADVSASILDRGRAYLAMNCAHCHNPEAWDTPAEGDFDFRHEIPIEDTGIQNGKDKISRNVTDQEMPFIGTTMTDEEGVKLLVEYLNSL